MLCDECKKRGASIFITTVTNGVSADRSLCAACYQKRVLKGDPALTEKPRPAASGNCKYCGASVAGNCAGGSKETGFWCVRCGEDMREFNKKSNYAQLFQNPPPQTDAAAADFMRLAFQLERAKDQFMRQRVKERANAAQTPAAPGNSWPWLGVDRNQPFAFQRLIQAAEEIVRGIRIIRRRRICSWPRACCWRVWMRRIM